MKNEFLTSTKGLFLASTELYSWLPISLKPPHKKHQSKAGVVIHISDIENEI